MNNSIKKGCFYIVATPIGNLADITHRAIEILKSVDVIAAEDTRHSLGLLSHYGVNTPLISLHQHNEQQRVDELLSLLQDGKAVALISDAGTPLISDPGERLIKALHQHQIPITSIPGPCAAINGLVVSGLPCNRFVFEGFLPVKKNARRQRIAELVSETRTIIFYEAPHRLIDLLELLIEFCGQDRLATIAREMTKTFETIHQNALGELLVWVSKDSYQTKGEIVLILAGAKKAEESVEEKELTRILSILLAELPLKQAVLLASSITSITRNKVYDLALSLK